MQRILTGAVLLVALWLAIVPAPPVVFVALATVIITLAARECYLMLEHRCARPLRWLGIVTCWALVWSFTGREPAFGTALPLAVLVVLGSSIVMWRRPGPAEMLDSLCSTVFPVLFVGLMLGHLVALRSLPGEDGKDPLLLLFVCVYLGDTAAYYVGTRFGRRKLAPALSPKKSWEGAVGGTLASIAGGVIAHFTFYQRLPISQGLLLGLLLGVAGIVGDLAESLVKRASGVKDSSGLLPGHGGALDRTDSLLFAAPILYYYCLYVMRMP